MSRSETILTLIAVISVVIMSTVILWSAIAFNEVLTEQKNCQLWIRMNSGLSREYMNEQVGFESYPDTTNLEFFKIRFHADHYQCDRWWNYDKVVQDIENDIGDEYFNDSWLRSKHYQP